MRRTSLLLLLFAIACSSTVPSNPPSYSVGPPGTVSGTVTLNGSPLPGATLTLAGMPRGKPARVSDANGLFTFANLPPGTYKLKAELEGIQTQTMTVMVTGTDGVRVQIGMRVSSVAEAITVTAEAPSVLQSGQIGFSGPPKPSSGVVGGVVGGVYGGVAGGLVGTAYSYRDAASTESYAPIQESGFVDAAKEATSTFSIDVDRAAYTNIRRMLAAKEVPPHDAVRIEEMVNYFTYNYPNPTDGRPFSVTTEVAGAPWNPAHRLLRIGVQGQKLAPWAMKPNNLVFLIDDSGSMSSPDKLPLLKKAFRLLVDQLRAEDRVAIVVYAGSAGLVLPSTSGADKSTILAAIDALQPGGSTNGEEGIRLAYDIAKQHYVKDGVNRVILATDGDFNVGVSSEAELEKLIEEKRKDDIALTVIGFGTGNLQDSKMELLADKGNGNYAYVDTLVEAQKVFVEELGGTLVTIAKDVKLQIDFDPKLVASYRLVGYEDRRLANKDFADDTKDAGELGSGHSVTALYEIEAKGTGKIGTLKVRYKAPKSETSELLEYDVNDTGQSDYAASDDFKFAAAVAEFGMLLRDSEYKGSATWADALERARISRGADLEGYRGELVKMIEAAEKLTKPKVAEAETVYRINTGAPIS